MKQRSMQNLSHEKLLTCNMGELIPIGCYDVVPGDTIRHDSSQLIRTQPLLYPTMHKVECAVHHWFVPFRLVWSEWENFITGGADGTSAPTQPYITTPAGTGFAESSLADYLGITPGVPDVQTRAFYMRGYNLIWNNFYRDEQLQTPVDRDWETREDSAKPVPAGVEI